MDGIDLAVDPSIIAKPREEREWRARICPTGAPDIVDWLEVFDAVETGTGLNTRDLVVMNLDIAEKQGSFRRLLPVEKICTIKNYKLHKKHPQWITGKGLQPPGNDK
jgi:hypothetical protein